MSLVACDGGCLECSDMVVVEGNAVCGKLQWLSTGQVSEDGLRVVMMETVDGSKASVALEWK